MRVKAISAHFLAPISAGSGCSPWKPNCGSEQPGAGGSHQFFADASSPPVRSAVACPFLQASTSLVAGTSTLFPRNLCAAAVHVSQMTIFTVFDAAEVPS